MTGVLFCFIHKLRLAFRNGTGDLLACGFASVNDRDAIANFTVGTRDDVHGRDGPDAPRRGRAGIDGSPHSSDLTPYDRGDKPGINLFVSDKAYISSFHHRVGGLDHRHQAHAFNHSKRFHIIAGHFNHIAAMNKIKAIIRRTTPAIT